MQEAEIQRKGFHLLSSALPSKLLIPIRFLFYQLSVVFPSVYKVNGNASCSQQDEFQKEFPWLAGRKLFRGGKVTWLSFGNKLRPEFRICALRGHGGSIRVEEMLHWILFAFLTLYWFSCTLLFFRFFSVFFFAVNKSWKSYPTTRIVFCHLLKTIPLNCIYYYCCHDYFLVFRTGCPKMWDGTSRYADNKILWLIVSCFARMTTLTFTRKITKSKKPNGWWVAGGWWVGGMQDRISDSRLIICY